VAAPEAEEEIRRANKDAKIAKKAKKGGKKTQ